MAKKKKLTPIPALRPVASQSSRDAAAADHRRQQLLELWRTLRSDPEAAAKIVTGMDPAEAKQIKVLWAAIRKATKRKPSKAR